MTDNFPEKKLAFAKHLLPGQPDVKVKGIEGSMKQIIDEVKIRELQQMKATINTFINGIIEQINIKDDDWNYLNEGILEGILNKSPYFENYKGDSDEVTGYKDIFLFYKILSNICDIKLDIEDKDHDPNDEDFKETIMSALKLFTDYETSFDNQEFMNPIIIPKTWKIWLTNLNPVVRGELLESIKPLQTTAPDIQKEHIKDAIRGVGGETSIGYICQEIGCKNIVPKGKGTYCEEHMPVAGGGNEQSKKRGGRKKSKTKRKNKSIKKSQKKRKKSKRSKRSKKSRR